MMGSRGEAAQEALRLRDLLEKAKQFARERYRGPEAIDVNTEILNLDPNQVGSYTRRGVCYLATGNLDDAEEDFLDALELDPNNRIAINRLEDIEEARAQAEEIAQNEIVSGWLKQYLEEHAGDRAPTRPPVSPSVSSLGHHSVYVVELKRAVLREAKFLAANPDYDPAKPCVYVGLTGLTPEERFENHKEGYKSSKLVHKYGVRLLPDPYEHLNPMTYAEAAQMEVDLAEDLREEGYAVWSH